MRFDNGVDQIDHDPVRITMTVPNDVQLMRARSGAVVGASVPYGGALRRRRTIELELTTAELTALRTFLDDLGRDTFLWTDTQSRIWNARWLGVLQASEVEAVTGGLHAVRLELLLESVSDDTGRTAYANTDVGQMSIQKSGASELHFPLAYRAPLDTRRIPAASLSFTGQIVATDPDRRTARIDRRLVLQRMADDFITEMEDYYVDTLVGATHPFTVSHFRDADDTFRWVGPFSFTMVPGVLWDGSMDLREEVS